MSLGSMSFLDCDTCMHKNIFDASLMKPIN